MLAASLALAWLWQAAPLQEAITAFRAGRMKEALALLEKAANLEPERAEVWTWVGRVYAAQGQWERSVLCFQRACELNPKEEDACYYLGRNLYTLNRFEAALAALSKALAVEAETKQWRVYRAMAQAQEALGKAEEAESSFREAIRKERGQARADEDPRIDYGVFLYRQGRTEEALKPLEEAAKVRAQSARAQGELGRVLFQLGRWKEAAPRLEKAVQLDGKLWWAHLLLGQAYMRLGRSEEGRRHLEMGEKGLAKEGYGASRGR
jgi:tetratricopeptide (TPR) repeat protein